MITPTYRERLNTALAEMRGRCKYGKDDPRRTAEALAVQYDVGYYELLTDFFACLND